MTWKIKIKHREEQKVSKWSGGTTTELALYPPNSSYIERDFLWRISTATVEDVKSTFTSLPNYNRIIMPLSGDLLKLHHQNHYDKELKSLETDAFHGSWITASEGKVQDFNLMFADACGGSIQGYRIQQSLTINMDAKALSGTGEVVTIALYILGDTVKVDIPSQNDNLTLVDGDFVTFTGSIADNSLILNMAMEENGGKAIIVCTTIKYSNQKVTEIGL